MCHVKCPRCGTLMLKKEVEPCPGTLNVAHMSTYFVCPKCGYAIKHSQE